MDNQQIKKELQDVVDYTTMLSFPFLAKKETKDRIIFEEKTKIDNMIETIISTHNIDLNIADFRDDIWEKAQHLSAEEFKTLPEKLKINSFYLQEMMHQYAERQINIVSNEVLGETDVLIYAE